MLSKKYRLIKTEIPILARKGKRIIADGFIIKVIYDDTLENNLYTFVVSKKVDNRAVVRNTIKRKFRAAVSQLQKENRLRKGKYMFLVQSASLADKSSYTISTVIMKQLQ